MTCSECCLWLVEFLLQSERITDPHNFDEDEDEDPGHGNGGINGPAAPPTKPQSDDANANVPSIDTAALGKKEGGEEEGIKEFKRERMKQLFNKHGFNLAVFPGGSVKGVRDAFNVYAVLEVIPVGIGEVQLRGVETGLYVAMNKEGRLYGESAAATDNTVFIENLLGQSLVYLSKKYSHSGWYLGIKKTGDAKNGRKTFYPWGQKAILFVHRRPFMKVHPLKLLKNRHGFTLSISAEGKVTGERVSERLDDPSDKFSVLEFTPSSPPGAFRIRGVESDLYLAMNEKGWLYGERNRLDENTLFTEHALGRYFIYLSVRWSHLGWYVGIKRSGKVKKGEKTWYPSGQKAIQFSHVIPYPEPPTETDLGALGENFPPIAYIDDDDEEPAATL